MNKKDIIKEGRSKLEKIDAEIVGLLEKRFKESKEIIDHKKKLGIKVYDPSRENEILKKLIHIKRKYLNDNALYAIYERILDESRRMRDE